MRKYLLIALMMCVLVGVACAWPVSLEDWNYRQSHIINGSASWASNQTDYPIHFTPIAEVGTSTGENFYTNGHAKMEYDDIRFTSTGNTPTIYPLWIDEESFPYPYYTSSIWTNIDEIPKTQKEMYVYLGNSEATSISNGKNVFIIFDTFPGTTLNTTIWNRWLTGGTTRVSGGKVRVTGGAAPNWEGIGTLYQTTYPYSAILRIQVDSEADPFLIGVDERSDAGGGNSWGYFSYATTPKFFTRKAGSDQTSGRSLVLTDAHNIEIRQLNNTGIKFYSDLSYLTSHTTQVPDVNMGMSVASSGNTHYIDCYYALYRKYIEPEPLHSTWSVMEQQINPFIVDFSAVPTTGNNPLLVYFTDESYNINSDLAINCTIDSWQWSFGDGTANSTQQNPTHVYTTSGVYNVGLTVFNTTYGKSNSTIPLSINVTYDPNAPTADFTVTETCGDVGDTFYFIDFSTGGGLYAWNWSFGDGSYSELRNPTHQYAANGTYDVNLSVWGAYGFDSLLRENLITIPCGAPTPTPTPTVTVTTTPLTPGTTTTVEGGRLTPLAFVVLVFMVCGLTVYTFADNQNRNYLYIATAAVAMIVSFLLGIFLQVGTVSVDFVNTLDEVTVNESVLSTYDVQRVAITDLGFGWFFIFWGVVMLIITILAVIELFREPQRRYEE